MRNKWQTRWCRHLILTFGVIILLPYSTVAATNSGPSRSCQSTETPYQLKVPLGLEDEVDPYIPKDNPLSVEKIG